MSRAAFLSWVAKLRRSHPGAALHGVYEACGFGFGLQRELTALGITCHVVCPQKLDERNQRVKTDGRDAKALCQKLDRYVEGNKDALAVVRVPTPEEEQLRAVHRQREQLVRTRKQLEAHGRSLMVNHGFDPISKWWKPRPFSKLEVPAWLQELLGHTQPILLSLEAQIRALAVQLEAGAAPGQPRGLGALSSVVIDREIGDWHRFKNRRQPASYTGLCPGEYSSGNTRVQSCVTKHGNPRLRAALVETAWRLVPLPAHLQTGDKMAQDPGQGSARHRRGQKENDRGGGPPACGRPLAPAHRAAPAGRSRPRLLAHQNQPLTLQTQERNPHHTKNEPA